MAAGEFDIIADFFAPLTKDAGAKGISSFDLKDDAALLSVAPDHELVFTKDALISGVHFLANDPADLIARKALRVNLSDLAAMGAEPLGYMVGLAVPDQMASVNFKDEEQRRIWLQKFAEGLAQDQEAFNWHLMGGDTVSTTGPLMISITAIGQVSKGRALTRQGAQTTDLIYVSGSLGDSSLGLALLQGVLSIEDNAAREFLAGRYHLPQPRLKLGQALAGIATSAMDISDGLVADLGHICSASGLSAQIYEHELPVSGALGKVLERSSLYKNRIWNGGDDYELLFTVPAENQKQVDELSASLKIPLSRIGQMSDGSGVQLLDKDGQNISVESAGYRHF